MSDIKSSTPVELLTFRLSDQEYSLDIMCVREIRGWTRTTPLPHAPSYMKGVINLRGTVLPVMDLAERLGLPPREHTDRNVIIVVKFEETMTGLLVDAVSDIIALTSSDLQPPPDAASAGGPGVIKALTLLDDRMIRVLELSEIVPTLQSDAA
ncbi:chemotaxis protein CheW [Pseudosulfitobacter sp. DSM 107133]|jgi:purine-binding chemotaxis protein CheW|uniref:chemotaxis protein CheW n=1 Tax=Pseudosulfitobacter sp. DSM 107133 TaxID=2883100 RepID=UPI000DF144A7|nr:chemotaxis protein CheW [Pseudosulfitobacter sp. DSM 107133]UOA27249.1 Chemotaxis protein CheW [Pseudosulfitobacter sp. DSM 107133]